MKPFAINSVFEYDGHSYLITNRVKEGRYIICDVMRIVENVKEWETLLKHPGQFLHRVSLKRLQQFKKKGYIYNIRPAQN